MKGSLWRLALALGLFGTGWIAAKAQTSEPTFELRVDAPEGSTTVRCVRGCKLAWVERGINPNSTPQRTFEYFCTGTPRCMSGLVGGWVD